MKGRAVMAVTAGVAVATTAATAEMTGKEATAVTVAMVAAGGIDSGSDHGSGSNGDVVQVAEQSTIPG